MYGDEYGRGQSCVARERELERERELRGARERELRRVGLARASDRRCAMPPVAEAERAAMGSRPRRRYRHPPVLCRLLCYAST